MDIWYSIARDGKFEHPINAGPIINTEGNEITPFYDKKRAILYFSSDEHIGIGGYDIFYAEGAMSQWSSPSNMGVPINSEDNDIYLTINSVFRIGPVKIHIFRDSGMHMHPVWIQISEFSRKVLILCAVFLGVEPILADIFP